MRFLYLLLYSAQQTVRLIKDVERGGSMLELELECVSVILPTTSLFSYFGATPAPPTALPTIRTPETVCGKTKGTWGDKSNKQLKPRFAKERTAESLAHLPFAIEHILDASLGDDSVVTLEPLVLVLPDKSGVMAAL